MMVRNRPFCKIGIDKKDTPVLATASWYTPLPHTTCVRIGISRGPLPNGVSMTTVRYPGLTPYQSQREVPPELFHRNYVHKLHTLDPEFILGELQSMARGKVPVLCSWTGIHNLINGKEGCHRHLAADWFEKMLDIKVPELGAPPAFDRFSWWRMHPMAVSAPGNRPRTGPLPQSPTKAARAVSRLAQGKFKF